MTPKRRGTFLLYIFFLLISTIVYQPTFASPPAQEGDRLRIVTSSETGLYKFVGIDSVSAGTALPGATALQNGTPTAANAMADISVYGRRFGLSNPNQELQFMKASAYQNGSRSFRYQQVYQSVPVIAGEMIANYDGRGRLDALVGEISSNLTVSTTARVTPGAATTTALEYVSKATEVPVNQLIATTPALWIYDPQLLTPYADPPVLVWRLEVRAASSILPIDYLVLADAAFGGVHLAFNQIDTEWSGPARANTAVVPATNFSPVLPASAPVLPLFNFTYNPTGATYDSNHTTLLQNIPICATPPTTLSGGGSCTGGAVSQANAAHYFAYATVNYYKDKFNRNSIDNADMDLISNVNYCEPYPAAGIFCPGGFGNAFWDGTQMVYGDKGFFTSDDVVAHELTHGVTEFSSNLFYWYESGAINESMSDIFGELIDQANGINSFGGADSAATKWLMGEDLTVGAGRSMSNPPAYGDPDRTQSPLYSKYDIFSVYFDRGGVHTNSGIGNKAAYLMAEGGTFNGYSITALGNDKTAAIYYEVNTNLLPSGADYAILGAAIVQACNNILAGANTVGMTAADCTNASKAVQATQMHLPPAGIAYSPQPDLCPANYQVEKTAFDDDLESGFGAFSSGYFVDPLNFLGANGMPQNLAWQDSAVNGPAPYAYGGLHSAFGTNSPWPYGYDGTDLYLSYFQMNAGIPLPTGSAYYLYFDHSFAFEIWPGKNYDGSVLEYELDNSNTWIDAKTLFDAGQNYNGTIYNSSVPEWRNPLAGRQGFVQQSHGYVSTRYKLQSLAGHSVRFRWLIGADDIGEFYGWFLDNIKVYSCISTTAAPIRRYTTDPTPTLTWTRITWATAYEVQIADNSTFTVNVSSYPGLPKENLSFDVPTPLSLGTHYWRVRATGGTGVSYSPAEIIVIGS